ncbi:MAG: L-threonylcarbamoyladenylate synthase [Desulfurococcales archaeon]|nr:L-threonylcarbamoyladenylate synthase [Desulfurococcales archaeon]
MPGSLVVDPKCPDPEILREAASILRSGGLVVYPTDTLYGLGADPHNAGAVRRVYEVKERGRDKPLPIILAEAHYAIDYVVPSPLFWMIARLFWPGPLTIVAPASPRAPRYLASSDGMIGVRLPDSRVARELARLTGGAIIGTSANKSGMTPPVTAQEAMAMLGDSVDLYIDGGPTPLGRPSTVIWVVGDEYHVLREGSLPSARIEEAVRDLKRL